MKTQTIKVEGLPEGYRAVAYRKPIDTDLVFLDGRVVTGNRVSQGYEWLIIEKIQPFRITFDEITDGSQDIDADYYIKYKWWREVKETDIPLTKEEHYLKLTKKDMLELIEHIKLGGQLNHKIAEFIKENS